MRYFIILIIFSISKTIPVIAQDKSWQKITVGDSVTVDFPSRPKRIVQDAITGFGLYADGVLYSFVIQPNAGDAGLTLEEKRRVYEEAMQGAAEKANATEILSKTSFAINGFEGLEATFIPKVAKLKNPVLMRMVLVNGTLYGQMFSASASPEHTAARQQFFASFVPQVRPVAATPAETHTRAYKLGQLIGGLLFYGAVIGGIIFLFLRWSTPRKN